MKRTLTSFHKYIFCAVLVSAYVTPVKGDIIIHEFENAEFAFEYGSWLGNVVLGPTYVTIGSPATASGGAGMNGLLLDVSEGIKLEVRVRPYTGNEVDQFNFILKDSDGTEVGWQFHLNEIALEPEEFSVLTVSLISPHFINSTGMNGSFNPDSVTSWQLQGDFSSSEPLRLQFDKLTIIENTIFEAVIPEPSTLAFLIFGIGSLVIFSIYHRKINPEGINLNNKANVFRVLDFD